MTFRHEPKPCLHMNKFERSDAAANASKAPNSCTYPDKKHTRTTSEARLHICCFRFVATLSFPQCDGAHFYCMAIQVMVMTMSIPFFSAASHLYEYVPSFSLFQKAPTALCMPRRPWEGSDGVPRCWIMVLFAMYLYDGTLASPVLVFSMRDWRMVFWRSELR